MDDAHNLILVGGTGTGKTHLATALGIAAIHHEKRVRFFNAVDLVNLLELEKQQDKTGTMARKLIQMDVVILDELGYTNPNKFIFKFSSSQSSPAGEGIYENLLGLVLLAVPSIRRRITVSSYQSAL